MHDVIIIGAGPAGLSTAFWCDELGLDTLVLEQAEEIGGQLHRVYNPIENYLGLKARNGKELLEHFAANVDSAEFDLWTQTSITSVDLKARRVSLASGEELQSIAIVIATGIKPRQLGVPGETEFAAKGMIESGARDRHLFAGKDVCVVGGGDAAVENALLLAEVCPTVTLVHRGKKLRARREFIEKLQAVHCITVFTESVLTRIIGEDDVIAVEIQRKQGLKPFQVAVRGVLIRIGVEPNTEVFKDQLDTDEKGFVVVNSVQETNVPMVFAVGDVSNPLAPTISSATGAGATAAKVIASRLNARAAK
ncbi:MAG TPA: FAD-dependent oxidoreductase [Pyrinomonadaceae bacterium]|jgi:thioredoxin reductase (NADPH)|nr:FAD-dependent oxidoreductase [Pyrinomonadaceae bacterium]